MILEFTDQQVITITALAKVSSTLSIIGSSFIIHKCVKILSSSRATRDATETQSRRRRKHRFSAPYNRILIGLSICDLIVSLAFFISPSAVPFDETKERSFFNAGNQMTCNIQGSMFQFGLMGGMSYNTCLAVYFCLFVRDKVEKRNIFDLNKEKTYRRKEILLHLCILLLPVFTTAYLVSNGYFNPTVVLCWIKESPRDCVGNDCIRGKRTPLFRLLFMQIPLVANSAITLTSLILIHRYVKKLSKESLNITSETPERNISVNQAPSSEVCNNSNSNSKDLTPLSSILIHTEEGDDSLTRQNIIIQENNNNLLEEKKNSNSNSNLNSNILRVATKVRRLSLLYLLAGISVWMPLLIQTTLIKFFVDDPQVYYYGVLVFQILSPTQGFFNALIFGKFNALIFLYRQKFVILGIISISVVIYFLLCDSDTCVYGEMSSV